MGREAIGWSRRDFLKSAGTAVVLGGAGRIGGLPALAAAATAAAKISDIQTMTLTGPRTYVLVKVVADNGHYGIAEAYGLPSIGVKEQIEALKPLLVGKNPLEIDAIYTYMGIGGPELSLRAFSYARGQRHRDGALGPGGKDPGGADNDAAGWKVP
jgi:hypothetical protein